MRFASAFLLIAATAQSVVGHYSIRHLIFNDVKTDEFEYVREIAPLEDRPHNDYYVDYPLYDPSSNKVRCGRNASVVQKPIKTAQIRAGDTVGFGNGNSEFYIFFWHAGFVSAWLSKAPDGMDLNEYEGDGDWFKFASVAERTEQSTPLPIEDWRQGYNHNETWKWGIFGLDSYNFTIPKTTPAGKYLLRFEQVFPNDFSPRSPLTQYYVGCAHVEITNDGVEGTPGPLVKIPGHYTQDQPDIHFDSTNTDPKDVVPPKPDVWRG